MMGTNSSAAPVFTNMYAPYDFYEARQEKSGHRLGVLIVIGVILVLVIGGGLTGLLYFTGQPQSTPEATSTFTISTPTVKPLFRDTFTNNDTGWLVSSNPGISVQQVGGGLMTLEDDNNQLLWEVLPGKTFSDFRLDVDARLTKGNPNNAYGVYFRGALTGSSGIGTYYRLEIYGDGTFAIFKGLLDTNGNTVNQRITYSGTASPAILTEGHTNHLTIIAKGSSMTFMVNGVKIYTFSDPTYRGGLIALFVSNLPKLSGGAQATFANLAIFPAS